MGHTYWHDSYKSIETPAYYLDFDYCRTLSVVTIYIAFVRFVLKYGCIVRHSSLPNYLSEKVEKSQKRCFQMIYSNLPYHVAFQVAKCPSLFVSRNKLCIKFFNEVRGDHKLSHIVWPQLFTENDFHLRNKGDLTFFKCKSERLRGSFFPR